MSVFRAHGISHQQVTGLSSAQTLTVPAYATGITAAYLQARTQDVYFTFDGTTPSATNGLKLKADDAPFYVEGGLSRLKFLEAAASASLHVAYMAA